MIKSKGNIHIASGQNSSGGASFVIDGKSYTPEEFGELIKSYEGFNMQYQIMDGSDSLLGEDEYLVPLKITEDTILEELEMALDISADWNGFLSYEEVPVFDELYAGIIEKIKILTDCLQIKKAQKLGCAIAKRLHEIETDDDCFPYDSIKMLCDTVDPFGTNEELCGYLEF